jgi:hypothetical protein
VLFLIAHLAGLREFTSVLNGTVGSTGVAPDTAALLGLGYIGLYLMFVLAVPVLVLAAGILALGNAVAQRRAVRTETVERGPISGPAPATSLESR